MRHIYDFDSYQTNEKNWSKDVDVTKGKMHKLLNIPEGKKILDVYTSGENLPMIY